MEMDLSNQVALSSVVVWLLQWAKKSALVPVFSEDTARRIQIAVGALAALVATLGIGYAFDYEAGTLTITGLSTATIVPALIDSGKAFIYQQLIYHGVAKPKAAAAEERAAVS